MLLGCVQVSAATTLNARLTGCCVSRPHGKLQTWARWRTLRRCVPPQRGSAEGGVETQQTDEKLLRGTRILKSSQCKVPGSATVARTSWWERTPPPSCVPRRHGANLANQILTLIPQTCLEAARLSGLFLRGQVSLVCWEEQHSHKFLLNKRGASRGVKFYARPSSRPDLLWQIAILLHGCVINPSSIGQLVLSL